jgi:hypothetical protein
MCVSFIQFIFSESIVEKKSMGDESNFWLLVRPRRLCFLDHRIWPSPLISSVHCLCRQSDREDKHALTLFTFPIPIIVCSEWRVLGEILLWMEEAYGGGDWEDDHQLMRLPSLRLGRESPPPLLPLTLSHIILRGQLPGVFVGGAENLPGFIVRRAAIPGRRLSSILALPFWCCLSPRSFASAYARCTANVPLSLLSFWTFEVVWKCWWHLAFMQYSFMLPELSSNWSSLLVVSWLFWIQHYPCPVRTR